MRIDCPECGKKLEVPEDFPARPFCSPRCRALDLGRWFNEEYRIAGQPGTDDVGLDESSGESSEGT